MPPPPASPDGAAYHYEGDELTLFAEAHRWKAYWMAHLRPYLRGHLLEVGAGLGVNTVAFAREALTAVTCLEPDPDLAAQLRERVAEAALPLPPTVTEGDTRDLAPAPAAYDTIAYIDVLEHIADDAGELRRATRLLRPGGHLIVLSPAHQVLYSPFDAAIGHVRRYERASLAAAAPPTLPRVALDYLDACGLLASLANKVLLRQAMPTPQQIRFWDRVLVPASERLDPLLGYRLGKTIVGVWRKPASTDLDVAR